MKLDALLHPKSVAVIGASRSPGKVSHAVVRNLIRDGYEGAIIPVNPNAEEILELRCYADVGDYDAEVDLAVIVVPAPAVKSAVERALVKGVGAIAIITAGFKEVGPEGAALERELARLCRARGVPLLGPNCVGVMNVYHKMNATFATQMPSAGGVSVLSQSGAVCASILDLAVARKLGLAKLLSIGNKADLTETELLAALGEDDDTKIIVGYLEDIVAGDEFIRTAEHVAATKPVVLMKAGTTEAGARAVASHTGSFAGGDIAYAAAFKRAGVIRAESYQELFDLATAFAMQPPPKGKRVAIVTNAGGPGIMATDAMEKAGLVMAELSEPTRVFLKGTLPAIAAVGNPIDIVSDAGHERFGLAVKAAAEDPAVDALIVLLEPVAVIAMEETAEAIAANARDDKPVLASFLGEQAVLAGRQRLRTLSVPDYPTPERAVTALKAMCDYVAWRDRPARVVSRIPVNRRRAERIIARHLRTGRTQVSEIKSKEILSAYGFAVPQGHLARSADEAVEVAERIGYPVAMKIVSTDIALKSQIGGVKLDLWTPELVSDAFDLMMLRVAKQRPDARPEGVYVEEMAPSGSKVIIGMSRDPQFGPMLMFGLGGIFVEVMKDAAFHLAPITAGEARQMLVETRSYALLGGERGRRGVDLDSIAGGLQRISQLATDFPQIAELDINPLVVGPAGREPVVVDARIILAEARSES